MRKHVAVSTFALCVLGGCGLYCLPFVEQDPCSCDLCTGVCPTVCLSDEDCQQDTFDPCEVIVNCEDCACWFREPTCESCSTLPGCE